MKRLHAWVMAHFSPKYEAMVRDRKAALFSAIDGTIVEIGPGSGPNLKHYPAGAQWIGIEPNPYMHPYLRREAASLSRNADVRLGSAEKLPVDDGAADCVVGTLVLCSVRDPEAVLCEILRVLKPGGRFIFLEHVAAKPGTALHKIQRAVRTPWTWVAGGCHPDRDTASLIRAAGFASISIDEFRLPLGIVSPQIAGWAMK